MLDRRCEQRKGELPGRGLDFLVFGGDVIPSEQVLGHP